MKKILSILFFLFAVQSIAQDLLNSRKSSYYTYIFRINEKEALKIYNGKNKKIEKMCLNNLIDSFPTDSQYNKTLSFGHYLKVYNEQDKLKFAFSSVYPVDLKILNNSTDLCLQVFDLSGNLVSNASLKIGNKKISFDKKIQAYKISKSNKKGILIVEYEGNTSFFDLSRQYNVSGAGRFSRKLFYVTPIKYAWIPINFVIHLPIDGVKSISRNYTVGTINSSKNFFVRLYERTACLFDDYYCNEDRFANKYKSYLVYNKPKYMPGDTVKFKAFVCNKKGKAIDKKVRVVFTNGAYKQFKLTELNPYRDGGYEYQFFLHDSLQLQLDKNFAISLEKRPGKPYVSESFKYEDYELSSVNLSLRSSSAKQYRGTAFEVFVRGKDENDLNLTDARVQLLLKCTKAEQYFDSAVFIPDTLYSVEKPLDFDDETKILIPDSIFPLANLDYELEARLLTSDNDMDKKILKISYFHKKLDAEITMDRDSMVFKFFEDGTEINVKASIFALDNFGNRTDIGAKSLPFKQNINPYYSDFLIVTEDFKKSLNVSNLDAQLECYTERNKDSIHIRVTNARNIPFSYFIYKTNNELLRGYGRELEWHTKNTSEKNYYVMLQYLWGGQIQNKNYLIQLTENKLNIEVEEPKLVYPGQKTNIKIKVSDQKGNPVKDADLTGFSLTRKFKYTAPPAPTFEKYRKSKSVINSFRIERKTSEEHIVKTLDFNKWKRMTGLDTIEYYRFLYPGKKIYQFTYRPKDETTQFSPFVINKGLFQSIHVIYVDRLPVYFSWSTNVQKYSFPINPGYHQIILRTRNKEYTIDSMYFNSCEKLIFSISDSVDHKYIKIKNLKPELSATEKINLHRYIMPYRNTFGNNLAFLEQNNRIIYLKPEHLSNYHNLAGPVYQHGANFTQLNAFKTYFNFEPYFDYEFQNGLLKMRTFEPNKFPIYLYSQPIKSLSDLVIKKQDIINEWNEYLEKSRYSDIQFLYSNYNNSGKTKLLLSYKTQNEMAQNIPLHILMKNMEGFQYKRVVTGQVYDLAFTSHEYIKLVFIYPGNHYAVYDSISIKPGGINYFEFGKPKNMISGVFNASEDAEIYPKEYIEVKVKNKRVEADKPLIFNSNNKGNWRIISGRVTDENGDPMPGTTIMIKGTELGTVADLDGKYSIEVPDEATELVFSFMGMVTQSSLINGNFIETKMESSSIALDDVIVIGYGTIRKQSLTASISVVENSYSLQGKMAGVSITNTSLIPGSGESIRIRGASALNTGSEPLYVIDGVVYTGSELQLDPNQLTNVEVLKGEEATAIYGSRAANGVVIISTNGTVKISKNKGAVYDEEFYNAAMSSNSIRNNFSDYAFWQPRLKTDKDGTANFDVVFPDDVTGWETHYMAMNGKKKSGQAKGFIRSYKPLMGQLSVPRFLTRGDSVNIITKVKNYTADSVTVSRKFEANDSLINSIEIKLSDVSIDTMLIGSGSSDTLKMKFSIQKSDGYFDGEEKKIPVFQVGLEETKGQFFVLDKDSTISPVFDTTLSSVHLYAKADELEVITDEIDGLIHYKYACNEQLASKLKGLLSLKYICEFKKEKFKHEKETKEIIKMLLTNRQDNGLWGWWNRNGKSYWISIHVIEALLKAKEMGYQVSIDTPSVFNDLIYSLESELSASELIRVLYLFKKFNIAIDYQRYINKIEQYATKTLFMQLSVIELKQLCGLNVKADTVFNFSKKTLFGNLYFAIDEKDNYFYENEIQNTLTAYRIIRRDTSISKDSLLKIRNYLFENRGNAYWQNTYESAKIIETIVADITTKNNEMTESALILSGDINKTINKFPFGMKIDPKNKISISKTGNNPIYLTTFQRYWNPMPKSRSNDFEIQTEFKENNGSNDLISGKTYKILATVIVKKDAEYVMIEIPIPGSCSYNEKAQRNYNEIHREYYKQKVSVFCEYLKAGTHQFEVEVIPRYTGIFTLNPAKVELMYFPTFNANNEIKKVRVK